MESYPGVRRLPFAIAIAAALAPLLAAVLSPPPATAGSTRAAARRGKKRRCPKGKKLVVVRKHGKVVKKHGKPVKKCVRRRKPKPHAPGTGPSSSPFEAPGKVLEGDAAKPFLQRYLLNSTFTDCLAGWPSCAVEQRYSHGADGTFHYCRLTSTAGADISVTDEYGIEAAKVEPDGSWTFREVVVNSGNYSHYEWSLSTTGTVRGAYQFAAGSPIEQIGPLQYVGGIAKDCSY